MIREIDYNTILSPLMTEKSTAMQATNQYAFKVRRTATKAQIKSAVEEVFSVKVKTVRVVNVKGETKIRGGRRTRTQDWKKAYITCLAGETISLFEN